MRNILLLIGLLFVSNADASIVVRILDKNDAPLKNAVITFQEVTQRDPIEHTITQKKYQFEPEISIIHVNDKVNFPNNDKVVHHIYSFSDTGVFEFYLDKGDNKQSISFDKPGIAILGCNIHDSMTGYIHILDKSEQSLFTDTKGRVTFKDNLPKKLYIWHANQKSEKSTKSTLTLTKIKDNEWLAKTNIENIKKKKPKKSGRY